MRALECAAFGDYEWCVFGEWLMEACFRHRAAQLCNYLRIVNNQSMKQFNVLFLVCEKLMTVGHDVLKLHLDNTRQAKIYLSLDTWTSQTFS